MSLIQELLKENDDAKAEAEVNAANKRAFISFPKKEIEAAVTNQQNNFLYLEDKEKVDAILGKVKGDKLTSFLEQFKRHEDISFSDVEITETDYKFYFTGRDLSAVKGFKGGIKEFKATLKDEFVVWIRYLRKHDFTGGFSNSRVAEVHIYKNLNPKFFRMTMDDQEAAIMNTDAEYDEDTGGDVTFFGSLADNGEWTFDGFKIEGDTIKFTLTDLDKDLLDDIGVNNGGFDVNKYYQDQFDKWLKDFDVRAFVKKQFGDLD